jgi:hypothetical protein
MKDKEKKKTYVCGEDFDAEFGINTKNIMTIIKKFFRIERLVNLHAGNISDYITWVVLGATLFIILSVLIW